MYCKRHVTFGKVNLKRHVPLFMHKLWNTISIWKNQYNIQTSIDIICILQAHLYMIKNPIPINISMESTFLKMKLPQWCMNRFNCQCRTMYYIEKSYEQVSNDMYIVSVKVMVDTGIVGKLEQVTSISFIYNWIKNVNKWLKLGLTN